MPGSQLRFVRTLDFGVLDGLGGRLLLPCWSQTTAAGPQRAARSPMRPGELEIGTSCSATWLGQDEDDRGERDDKLISKDAKELNGSVRRTRC